MGDEGEAMTIAEKIKARVAEQRELEKQIPLHTNEMRPRPRVAKDKLWTRDQKLELAKLAEAFLNAKAKARA